MPNRDGTGPLGEGPGTGRGRGGCRGRRRGLGWWQGNGWGWRRREDFTADNKTIREELREIK